MSSALTCMVNAMLSMVVVCVVSPVAMLALGPLLLFYWRVQVRTCVCVCVCDCVYVCAFVCVCSSIASVLF